MPSRLKSLELQGYKTFAVHTNFVFAETVTAIVGPNGSGKSNIADSIRWVLGEQSYSLLRGKKTEDMIFSGSELLARANMASVTLTFDNSDGWLPIDFTEVAITRRAYRDGENEYLLNGQRVRLRDISELLARSGLAERTYTIIGQGLVDAALALKAEERRRLFEEAAGIGLYRSRREESLRRLETTRHNLERIHDILAELLPRLRSLERQAKRAQEYDQVRADLRVYLRDWYGYHWHLSQRELVQAKDISRQCQSALEQERASYAQIDESINTFRKRLSGLRGRLNSWHRRSSQLHNQRETISRDLAVLEERTHSLLDQQKKTQSDGDRLMREVEAHQERLSDAKHEEESLAVELDEARSQIEEISRKFRERQAARADADKKMQEARQSLASLVSSRENLRVRLIERQNQTHKQEQTLQDTLQQLKDIDQVLITSEEEFSKAVQERQNAEFARQECEEALQEHHKIIKEGESARKKASENLSKLQAEQARLEAQLEVLVQAENSFSGFAAGTKLLLQAARESRIKGVRGAFSNFLDVPAEYEAVIGAALGEYMDAVILVGENSIDVAINELSSEAVRAALLPLEDLIPEPVTSVPLPPGCQRASEVIRCDPEYRPALDLLLGNTWIVPDRNNARSLVHNFRANQKIVSDFRFITLQGEVFHVNGIVLAGKYTKSGVLARPRQRRELQDQLGEVKTHLDKVNNTIHLTDQKLAELQKKEDDLGGELNRIRELENAAQSAQNQAEMVVEKNRRQQQFLQEQCSHLENDISGFSNEKKVMTANLASIDNSLELARSNVKQWTEQLANLVLDELQAQLSHWNTRAAVTEQAVRDANTRIQERQTTFVQADQECQLNRTRAKEILSNLENIEKEKAELRDAEGVIHRELSDLQSLIDPAEKELGDIENQQEKAQVLEAQARQVLSQAEQRFTQARINLSRRQETLDSLRQRIEDDFGLVAFSYAENISGPTPLPLDGMVEQLPVLNELPLDLEENIRRQKTLLRRIGPINPEAQKEYEEVQQRYDFLTTQVADLNNAETGIKEVIAELDLLMEREFRKTFDAVAREFREIFTRLFGGGSARLVLTDPQDLTVTGIDIEARLPGRREQGLSLLSGGERSLTASALVFSLLKVSPTPFCVFDEVDAMLDEANVSRFREFLEELSKSTQFITITHNRNTVQVADVIYGITMGRDSASQIVSLKLDEVSQIVE